MVKLSVCLDLIAAIRRMGGRIDPDPVAAAVLAQVGGADGVTVSWLPEGTGLQPDEFPLLRRLVQTHLTLIISPADEVVQGALTLRPDMVTFVPTGYQSAGLGSDWANVGWPETDTSGRSLDPIVQVFQDRNILVNVLVSPSATDVRACSKLNVDSVHLDASRFATAANAGDEQQALNELASTAKVAARLNMGVSIGRGVTPQNLPDLAGIWEVEEVVVGHAVAARAMAVGLERAVRDLVDVIRHAPNRPGE